MKLSNKAQQIIQYAQKTTNTLQWCNVGIFSGNGERGASEYSGIFKEIKSFLNKHCRPFTREEILKLVAQKERNAVRYAALAIRAIEQKKFYSASTLSISAQDSYDKVQEIELGAAQYYKIN